jgi:hypothetical protein
VRALDFLLVFFQKAIATEITAPGKYLLVLTVKDVREAEASHYKEEA